MFVLWLRISPFLKILITLIQYCFLTPPPNQKKKKENSFFVWVWCEFLLDNVISHMTNLS